MLMLDLGCEDTHGFVRRRRERFTGSQAKTRAMARANNFVALDFAARQSRAIVSADILDGEKSIAAAHHGNHAPACGDGLCLPVLQIRCEACIDPGRHHRLAASYIMPVCKRASSDIMV
jgi:hypothetical protein